MGILSGPYESYGNTTGNLRESERASPIPIGVPSESCRTLTNPIGIPWESHNSPIRPLGIL
eukprot:7007795-Pyramimonas_sp.AAC.1